jgi:hypothetical protein
MMLMHHWLLEIHGAAVVPAVKKSFRRRQFHCERCPSPSRQEVPPPPPPPPESGDEDDDDDDDRWTDRASHVTVENFTGSTPRGPTFTITSTIKPAEIFLRFFSSWLFLNIAKWKSKFIVTTVEEIRAWFGIRLLKVPDIKDYWSSHPIQHTTTSLSQRQ